MKHSCNIPKLVVTFLGWFSILGIVGCLVLIAVGKEIPAAIWPVIAGAPSALGAILSSTRTTHGDPDSPEPTDVTVVNKTTDPIPTTSQGETQQ